MPSPLVMLKPLPLTPIERAVTLLEPVLAINPLPAASSEPEAPFSVIWRVLWAPLSTSPTPVPPDKRRLFGSVGSWFSVINVCVCDGDAAIAPVVVWTVCPFWTIGTASVPVIAPACGSWVICTFAIMDSGSKCQDCHCSPAFGYFAPETTPTEWFPWSRWRPDQPLRLHQAVGTEEQSARSALPASDTDLTDLCILGRRRAGQGNSCRSRTPRADASSCTGRIRRWQECCSRGCLKSAALAGVHADVRRKVDGRFVALFFFRLVKELGCHLLKIGNPIVCNCGEL